MHSRFVVISCRNYPVGWYPFCPIMSHFNDSTRIPVHFPEIEQSRYTAIHNCTMSNYYGYDSSAFHLESLFVGTVFH